MEIGFFIDVVTDFLS